MQGYNSQMNRAYNPEESTIPWGKVAGVGVGGAIGYGLMRSAGIRARSGLSRGRDAVRGFSPRAAASSALAGSRARIAGARSSVSGFMANSPRVAALRSGFAAHAARGAGALGTAAGFVASPMRNSAAKQMMAMATAGQAGSAKFRDMARVAQNLTASSLGTSLAGTRTGRAAAAGISYFGAMDKAGLSRAKSVGLRGGAAMLGLSLANKYLNPFSD